MIKAQFIEVTTETRYYLSSLSVSAKNLASADSGGVFAGDLPDRETSLAIGGWRTKSTMFAPVTQGEERSRIRTTPLVQTFALARNFALNLYRRA